MWIVQKKESNGWRTIVESISEESFADEWLVAMSRGNNNIYRKLLSSSEEIFLP